MSNQKQPTQADIAALKKKHGRVKFIKQGGKFVSWVHGNGDFYYHPFTVPLGYGRLDLAPYIGNIKDYAEQTNFQHAICESGLAPRSMAEAKPSPISTPLTALILIIAAAISVSNLRYTGSPNPAGTLLATTSIIAPIDEPSLRIVAR